MGVAGAGEVFGCRAEFHGDADLMDHLTDADAHHVRAEDAVGLGIGKDFHKAGRLMIGPRAGIGLEGEFALLVLDAGLFQLGFGLADPGDLRVRVDHARHHVIIDMARLASDQLGDGGAVILCLVGQHRPVNAVTDCPDTVGNLEVIGGLDNAALVGLAANRFEAQPFGIGAAAHSDDDGIGFEGFLVTAFCRLHEKLDLVVHPLNASDLLAKAELKALFLEDALGFLGDLIVCARHDAVEIFDHGHIGAKTGPDRAELQPDNPGADNDQLFGNFLERDGPGIGHDALFVDLDIRQGGRLRPRRDHDILRIQRLLLAVLAIDLDDALVLDAAKAFDVIDLVLLHQEFDALGQALHGIFLLAHHLRQVDLDPAGLDAEPFEIILGRREQFRRVQQRLGGDAADIEAGAAEHAALVDDGGLQAKLAATDRAIVAAGAAADNHYIVSV